MNPIIATDHPALFKKERPQVVTLEDGRQVTILAHPDSQVYRSVGYPANFGGVSDKHMPECCYFFLPLPGGKSLQLFVNTESGLVVADLLSRYAKSGIEFVRTRLPQ
jgi:hypothetical protein